MKHASTVTQAEVWCYFLSSPELSLNSLLPIHVHCVDTWIIHLRWIAFHRSIWLVYIYSQSSLSSSLWFRRIVIVIIILCLQNACPRKFQGLKSGRALVSWSSMILDDDEDFPAGTATLSLGTLPLSLWPIALRDIWRNVF